MKERALGCLIGALVGDAAGATLEFLGHQPTAAEVESALTLPGGGVWKVAPGQITDDGELTLCLAQALVASPSFDLEQIAQYYAQWINSRPFDIGNTTSMSLGCFGTPRWQQIAETEGYAVAMTAAATQNCMASKANGSLMRATPLGIWGINYKDEELGEFARQDSRLSHPNPSCTDAVACYAIAIAHLIRSSGDRTLAFRQVRQWANQYAVPEVCDWLQLAANNVNISYSPYDGFVKIAFVHAFRHLLLNSDYLSAIRETLAGGGDTDTNACIVGGLIGAACGISTIPEKMQQIVLNCNYQQGANPRPSFLHPSQVPCLIEQLLSINGVC